MKKIISLFSALILVLTVTLYSCKKDAKAGFTATPSSVKIGEAVSFKDKVADRTNASFMYDFGDGTRSTDRNPSHAYTKAGTFHVYQTVTVGVNSKKGKGFSQVATTDVIVTDPFVAPVADFTAVSATVAIGQPVAFTNTSTNASWFTWSWNSSNGASWYGSYSERKDITLSFTDAGTYYVTLLADIVDPNYSTVYTNTSVNKTTASTKTMTITVTGTPNNNNVVALGMLLGKWTFTSDVYATSGFAAVTGGDAPVAGYKWMTSAAYAALSPNPFLHTSLNFFQDGSYWLIDPTGNQSSGNSGNWSMNNAATLLNLGSAGALGTLGATYTGGPNYENTEKMVGGIYSINSLSATSLVLEVKENCSVCIPAASRSRLLTLTK